MTLRPEPLPASSLRIGAGIVQIVAAALVWPVLLFSTPSSVANSFLIVGAVLGVATMLPSRLLAAAAAVWSFVGAAGFVYLGNLFGSLTSLGNPSAQLLFTGAICEVAAAFLAVGAWRASHSIRPEPTWDRSHGIR